MAHECEICKKRTTFGIKYARRGAAKSKGGSGAKISGKKNRTFRPNLQNIRIDDNGSTRRAWICTCCIQAGKIKKSPRNMQRNKAPVVL